MTYGAKKFKNGRTVGYLHFSTGKKIYLNPDEKEEFDQKVNYWQWIAMERLKNNHTPQI